MASTHTKSTLISSNTFQYVLGTVSAKTQFPWVPLPPPKSPGLELGLLGALAPPSAPTQVGRVVRVRGRPRGLAGVGRLRPGLRRDAAAP